MKKKLLLALPVVVGVTGASWAGSTYYSSNESRTAYERILSDFTDTTGLAFITTSYAPGFLQSEAITEIRMSEEPDAKLIARLRHNIEHSPEGSGAATGISATRVITTFITDDASQELLDAFDGKAPVTLLSSVGFNGTVSNQLTIAAFKGETPDGVALKSDGGFWNFDIDENGSVAGTGTWSGFNFSSPDVNITISPSQDSFNYTRHGPAVYSGGYELNLSEIVVNSPLSGINVGARDLGLNTGTELKNGSLNSDYKLWVSDIDAPIALDSAALSSSVGGIDISNLKDARDFLMQAQFTDVDALDESAVDTLVVDYLKIYGDLIQPGAFLSYAVELGNAGGEAEADIKLTFEGDGSPTGYDLLASPNATLADLVTALRVDVNMEASNDALALTPAAAIVDSVPLSPWVVDDSVNLKSDIVLDDMLINANGETIALEMMFGDVLYQPLNLDKLLSM